MISGSVPEWMESFPPESMTSLQNSMVGWYEWSVWVVVACSHTRFVNRWTSDSVSVGVGRTPVRYSIVHGMMILHSVPVTKPYLFETSSFYGGPVVDV